MNETCDRCGPSVLAGYRADGNGELYLCGHCSNRLWAALYADGWTSGPSRSRSIGARHEPRDGASSGSLTQGYPSAKPPQRSRHPAQR